MFSHSSFSYPCLRMDLVFNQSTVVFKVGRDIIAQTLDLVVKKLFLGNEKKEGGIIDYYQKNNHRQLKMSSDNTEDILSQFASDVSIDNIRFISPIHKGCNDYPLCVHYYNPNSNGVVRKEGRENINAFSISKYLGLIKEEDFVSEQQNFIQTMIYMYQTLGGINANLGIHGMSSAFIDNCFEMMSNNGRCSYENTYRNTRGAFWCTVFSAAQISSIGGIDALTSAVPFSSVQLFGKQIISKKNPMMVDTEVFAVCLLSERADQCSLNSLRLLYKFLESKNLIPDTSRLKLFLNNPGEEGVVNEEKRRNELNGQCYLLQMIGTEDI